MKNRSLLAVSVFVLMPLAFLTVGCATSEDRSELATEYYNLGTAFFDLGDLDRSADYFSRALELDQSLARASYNLARVYVLQNRFADAAELLEALRLEDPTNTVVLETIGYVYYSLEDLDLAREAYAEVIEIDPGNKNALFNLARVEVDRDALVPARDLLRRAVELNPDDTEALTLLASVAERLGDDDDALSNYERLRDAGSAPAEPLLSLARLYAGSQRYDKALEVLEEVLALPDAGSLSGEAEFSKAEILLTAAQETESGLAALESALIGGFTDADRIQTMLEDPRLVAGIQVQSLLQSYGMAGAEDPPVEQGDDPDQAGQAEPNSGSGQ